MTYLFMLLFELLAAFSYASLKSAAVRFDEEAGGREQDQLLHGFREAPQGAGGYEAQSALPPEGCSRASRGSRRRPGAGGEGRQQVCTPPPSPLRLLNPTHPSAD